MQKQTEEQLHAFMTVTLDGVEKSASRSGRNVERSEMPELSARRAVLTLRRLTSYIYIWSTHS